MSSGSILSNGEHGQLVSYKQPGADIVGRNFRIPCEKKKKIDCRVNWEKEET